MRTVCTTLTLLNVIKMCKLIRCRLKRLKGLPGLSMLFIACFGLKLPVFGHFSSAFLFFFLSRSIHSLLMLGGCVYMFHESVVKLYFWTFAYFFFLLFLLRLLHLLFACHFDFNVLADVRKRSSSVFSVHFRALHTI